MRLLLGIAILLAAGLAVTSYELVQTKNKEADLQVQRAQLVNIIHVNGMGFDLAANTLDKVCRVNLAGMVLTGQSKAGLHQSERCQSLVQDFRKLSAQAEDVR